MGRVASGDATSITALKASLVNPDLNTGLITLSTEK